MAEQNPFEDFHPSWLKAKPAASVVASPNSSGSQAEDILLQAVVAPFHPTLPNGFEPAVSNNYTNLTPVYNSSTVPLPLSVPDTLPPALENLRASPVKIRGKKARTGSSSWLFWLLAVVGLLVLGVLIYAMVIAAQGEERQRNSQPATDVGEMPRYPNSYLIKLNAIEFRPFEAKASLVLTKISQQACFRSPSNLIIVQQFYENQLSTKKFASQGTVGESGPQTEAWSSSNGNVGVAVGAISVGYLDFGLFNRIEPGQTVFCLFSGLTTSPGITPKVGLTKGSPVDTLVPNPLTNNENPPTRKPTFATATAVTKITAPNTTALVSSTPPPTPTPVNPLDQGA